MCGATAAHVDFVRLLAGTEALSEQLAADAVTTGLACAPEEDLQTYRVRLRFLQVSFARSRCYDLFQDPTLHQAQPLTLLCCVA
jgi:hypothetical protein